MTSFDLVARPLGLMAASFVVSFGVMPLLIRALRRLKMGKSIRDSVLAPVMAALHKNKEGTPTMGGIAVWGTVVVLALLLQAGCWVFGPDSAACRLNFLSRGQTWLPMALMVAAALVGILDDYFNVKHMGAKSGGLRVRHRLFSYTIIAVIGAVWFFTKLSWDQLHVPFVGTYNIGLWYVLFFIFVIVATSHSVNVTDGLDGLAGGTLLAAFGAYSVIAWSQGRTDLAVFCAAIIGGLLGFLWFNVNPAEVFMGDTGSMSLGTALAVVALMTNQPLLLLIIGLPFVVESASVLLQVASKKLRHKKLFLSSPLHHHLEALGWGEPKIVMRFWLISFVASGIGMVLALIDKV